MTPTGTTGSGTPARAPGLRPPARPGSDRRGRPGSRLLAGLAAGLAVAVLGAPAAVLGAPAAAAGPQDLVLSAPRLLDDRAVSVVATVPEVLSGRDLPPASFTASQAGRAVPLTAQRVLDGPAEVLLVVDTSGSPADVAARQSAAADLLRALPSQVPTTVLPGGDRTTARAALATVGALTPTGRPLLADLPAAPAVPRLVVALAGCPALQAQTPGLGGGGGGTVSVLGQGGPCDDAAARLAGDRPGVLRTGLDATGLIAGVDAVARSLDGQYALRTGPGLGPEPLEVTVRVGAAVAAATLAVPAGAAPGTPVPTTSPPGGSGDGSGTAVGTAREVPRGPQVAAVALAALAAGALVLELLARRRAAAGRA